MHKGNRKKIVSIFGVTGSVGKSTQEIIKLNSEKFIVDTIVCNNDVRGLVSAAKLLKPNIVIINDTDKYIELKKNLEDYNIEILTGNDSIIEASKRKVDILIAAISGFAGLNSTFSCIGNTGILALANKESIVCAGPIFLNKVKNSTTKIIPIDSEHNALYQILINTNFDSISKLIITGSGGPFKGYSFNELEKVTPQDAMKHPIWNMGKKISVDSATLMNKGLELIEAAYLFNVNQNKIEIIIHPESIIHGIVEFKDGSMNAGLSTPDMTNPISYALNYPNKVDTNIKKLNLISLKNLNFEEVDSSVFKSIRIARESLKRGHSFVVSLNAVNEVAVDSFIKDIISFNSILNVIEDALSKVNNYTVKNLDDIFVVDRESRKVASEIIRNGSFK